MNSKKGIKGFQRLQNFYLIRDGIAYIDVSTEKFPTAVCLIDEEDLSLIIDGKGRWYATDFSSNVIYATRSKRSVKIHRIIMKPPIDMPIDHINHDGLDNRKSNLRICTTAENCANNRISKKNKSGAVGVYRHTDIPKWVAQICINGKRKHIGCFDTVEDAVNARNKFKKIK